ncbi:hypothetical protein HDV00_009482 [Rhizophlyctis rosea]|nr:hypothetical protein HDV00_009482 [Rhizophlyctis rosea]
MSAKRRNYRKKALDDDDDALGDSFPFSPAPGSSAERGSSSAPSSEAADEDSKDESTVLREALELRKLRRRMPGIDTTDLLKGERKKRKEKVEEEDDPWKLKSGGGLVDIASVKGRQFNADGAPSAFATESNAMDTQRLMDDFIERELRKRKGVESSAEETKGNGAGTQSTDIRDELFEIPSHLQTQSKPVSEGNVTLSTSMLTAIPEVDLGIDIKLRNIEDTERAKRRMMEMKNAPDKDLVIVAAERFQTNTRRQTEALHGPGSPSRTKDSHREPPPPVSSEPQRVVVTGGPFAGLDSERKRFDKKTMATDEMVMERFRKRLRKH